jgi:hypothetical protein
MAAAKGASQVALRLFAAHGLAYPVATAWAFATVPVFVVAVASEVGLTLDDATVAHRVLLRVAWPAAISFVLVHLAGAVWAFDRNDPRGRRAFLYALVGLTALPVVGGGISWIWLMTR